MSTLEIVYNVSSIILSITQVILIVAHSRLIRNTTQHFTTKRPPSISIPAVVVNTNTPNRRNSVIRKLEYPL
jgi:hypothetical protein